MYQSKYVAVMTALLVMVVLVGCSPKTQEYQLTLVTEGKGSIERTPDQEIYLEGTAVQLKAVADAGWQFERWEGSGFDGKTAQTVEVVMNSDLTLKAYFADQPNTYTSTIYTATGNNSSFLEADGFTIGAGTVSNQELQKEILVTLNTPDANLSIGKAYALRRSADIESVYLLVELTNNSDLNLGFVHPDEIIYKDEAGEVLYQNYSFVNGSMGINEYEISTDTCLFSGEKGYITDISSEDIFTNLASIELTFFDYHQGFVRPGPKVIAEEFTYDPTNKDLFATIRNTGTVTAELDLPLHKYILWDTNNEPLFWGYLDQVEPAEELIGVQETRVLEENWLTYQGVATSLTVLTYFSPVSETETSVAMLSQAELATMSPEEINTYRNQREVGKFELLKELSK